MSTLKERLALTKMSKRRPITRNNTTCTANRQPSPSFFFRQWIRPICTTLGGRTFLREVLHRLILAVDREVITAAAVIARDFRRRYHCRRVRHHRRRRHVRRLHRRRGGRGVRWGWWCAAGRPGMPRVRVHHFAVRLVRARIGWSRCRRPVQEVGIYAGGAGPHRRREVSVR